MVTIVRRGKLLTIYTRGGEFEMRKALFISLLVLLLMTAAFTSAYATAGNSISPMASNYRLATARLSLNGGTATASGTLTGINGTTTKATVHLYLQQYHVKSQHISCFYQPSNQQEWMQQLMDE